MTDPIYFNPDATEALKNGEYKTIAIYSSKLTSYLFNNVVNSSLGSKSPFTVALKRLSIVILPFGNASGLDFFNSDAIATNGSSLSGIMIGERRLSFVTPIVSSRSAAAIKSPSISTAPVYSLSAIR